MCAHGRRIQEQATGSGQRLGLQVLPQALPDSPRLPTPEAHVNGMPVAQLGGQIPPRTARALEMEHRFEKLPVCQIPRRARPRMLGGLHGCLQFGPYGIADDFALG